MVIGSYLIWAIGYQKGKEGIYKLYDSK